MTNCIPYFLFLFLLLVLLSLIAISYYIRGMVLSENESEHKEKLSATLSFIYVSIFAVVIAVLVFMWFLVKGTPYEGHLMEWLNIVVRLMHITFGIAWIGASFYFVFLENALNRTDNVRDELAGNLWAVHGGGFYYLEKYKIAPKEIPKQLHWFKYEAYFTWLSGFSLLFVVYYFNAKAFLIDPNVLNIAPLTGIAIGIGSLAAGWIIYDLLCKSPLVKKGIWFALTGFIFAAGFAFFYSKVFSSRAAYIHFGAMLGTIMAANVFFVIIPSQKAMVKAAKEGKELDASLGKNAGLRSLHNNYLTLPVLFVMISNHFPSTFGNQYAWIVLAAISLGLAGLKHWLNLREKGQLSVWVMPVSTLLLLAVAYMTAPQKLNKMSHGTIAFAEVNSIVQKRCVTCHSAKPTNPAFPAPPNGVIYDTPADIVKLKDKIMQRVVVTKTMPQNNQTNMTLEEREIIGAWIEQGGSIK
ncbi:MAG: urate hydroxylase PuuD [Bacteroidota bacterium]|nr:urate hydroxylase PuuD [Bacteroidota bacterium]